MDALSEEDLRTLVWKGLAQLNLVAVYISSENGYEYATPAANRIAGMTSENWSDPEFSPSALIHPEDLEGLIDFNRQLREGKKSSMDVAPYRIIRKDGSVVHLLGCIVPLDHKGSKVVVGAMTDVTLLVAANEQMGQNLAGTINAMARVVEARDPYTAGHQRRVATLACAIAEHMEVAEETVSGIQMAGVIHDLGKLRVPADILSNPGKLTDMEFGIIKTHPQVAFDILKDIDFTWPVANIVCQHHERFDGSGYPQGLAGDDILIEARILGVADVVEAMASHRPYRPALGIETALEEISAGMGTRYAAEPAAACLEIFADGSFSFEEQSD